jgi:hypothetical protein
MHAVMRHHAVNRGLMIILLLQHARGEDLPGSSGTLDQECVRETARKDTGVESWMPGSISYRSGFLFTGGTYE